MHLPQCCGLLDSLRLPAYSIEPEFPTGRPFDNSCDRCTCSSSFQELVERDDFRSFAPIDVGEELPTPAEDPLQKSQAVGAATGYLDMR